MKTPANFGKVIVVPGAQASHSCQPLMPPSSRTQDQGPLSEEAWFEFNGGPYSHTPIIYAAKAGDVERLKELAARGFDLTKKW